MAAIVVTWNGTRIDSSDSNSTTSNIGGGSGAGGEPDILYQGTGATPEDLSRKIGTGSAGFYISPTQIDISTGSGTYQTCLIKYNAANSAALELLSVPGIEIRIGSGTAAYASYETYGSDNYPEKGGFVFTCVDPNITGYHTSTVGSPVLTAADYFGIVGDFTATSKSENLVLSAIDVGDGYTITGGGGADPTATFQDIVDFNSILSNRHGFFFALEGQEGAYGAYGAIEWGSSATAVDHQDDTASTIFFLDGFFAAGWTGILDNTENTSTIINPSGNTYISRGNTTTTDTRAVYNTSGTNGSPTRTEETFVNFAQFNSSSHFTYENCDIQTADLTQSGAIFQNGVLRCTSLSGVAVCDDLNFTNFRDQEILQEGSGHAFEITSTGTYSLNNLQFISFGADGTNNAAIYNNSGGAVTLNILNGGNSPTIRNGTGASTTINNTVTVRITVLDVNGSPVENARVLLEADTGGDLTVGADIISGLTNAFGVIEDTGFNFTNDQPVIGKVRRASASPYYKTSTIVGSITNSGFITTILLILDE